MLSTRVIVHMESSCGGHVGGHVLAGELHFNTNNFRDNNSSCSVTVTPDTKDTITSSRPRVAFYFTLFDVGSHCSETNVTVYDSGYSRGGTRDVIPGESFVTLFEPLGNKVFLCIYDSKHLFLSGKNTHCMHILCVLSMLK